MAKGRGCAQCRCSHLDGRNAFCGRAKQADEEVQAEGDAVEAIDVSARESRRIPSKKWPELIKKVWEADPLRCPKCSREMRIVSLIDEEDVIERYAVSPLGECSPHAGGAPGVCLENKGKPRFFPWNVSGGGTACRRCVSSPTCIRAWG